MTKAFDPKKDIDNKIPDSHKLILADLIIAWGKFESLVSQWVILSFGMKLDIGALLVGKMDIDNKLNRLQKLFAHHHLSGAEKIKKLKKDYKKHADIRNKLAHAALVGISKIEPDRLVFAVTEQEQGRPDHMIIDLVHLEQLQCATAFAESVSSELNELIDTLTERFSE